MPRKNSSSGLLLDGVFASEAIDTSGEIADIRGMDISSLEEGDGVANYEHEGPTGNNGQEIVGKIVYVKKIFKEEDCEDERQLKFWKEIKFPLLYGIVRLADGAGHPGAIALAAMIRDSLANKEPVIVRFSIEGSTIERDGNKLTRTIARRVALTFRPCNKTAISGVLLDPNAPPGFEKEPNKPEEKSDIAKIVETVTAKSEHQNPMYTKLSGHDSVIDLDSTLNKTMEAGVASGAPSTLTGGAALQREDLGDRKVKLVAGAKAALRDYDFYRKEAGPEDFAKFLKFRLPDADPEFLTHFADMVTEYKFKKAETDFPGDVNAKPEKAVKQTGTRPPYKEIDDDSSYIPVRPPKKGAKATRLIFPSGDHPRLRTTTNSPLFQMVQGRDAEGKKRKYPVEAKEIYFDPEFGFLHTPHGSFKVNIPDEAEFNDILNSPAVQGPHDAAMKNWKVLNGLLSEGKLPEEIIMHAALFSGMSPSVAVHMQELAFSHVQDMIARGMDPRKTADVGGPTENDAREFYGRTSTGAPLPKFLRDYWAGPQGDATRIGSSAPSGDEDETANGQKEEGAIGQQKGLLYQKQKWHSVENYNRLHDALVQYMHEHGTDARTIARTLQQYKVRAGSYEAAEKLKQHKFELEAVRRGLGQITPTGEIKLSSKGHEFVSANTNPGFFNATGAPDVAGFAPKTIRYALAMMGGGNVVVPDTHFIRHLFGLPMDAEIARAARETLGRDFKETKTYKEQPFAPNDYLKRVLWSENRPDLLESIDKYYMEHHPAFKYAANRFFGGHNDEQALFPGFWAHWLAVGPHEKAHGMNSRSFNGGTDHSAYWTVVDQVLRNHGFGGLSKGEVPDEHFIERTARAHNDVHKALGPGAATTFYYSHLVPMLLQHAAKNGHFEHPDFPVASPEVAVVKNESTLISLKRILDSLEMKKAEPEKHPAPETTGPKTRVIGGRTVIPGVLRTNAKQDYELLGEDKDHYHVFHEGGGFGRVAKNFAQVVAPPQVLNHIAIDSTQHAHSGTTIHPEQHELVHGMTFENPSNPPSGAAEGINASYSGWFKNAKGENVYIKYATPEAGRDRDVNDDAIAEASYYDAAKRFWGLGQHVPVATAVKHPVSGKMFAAIKGMDNSEHMLPEYDERHQAQWQPHHEAAIKELGDKGTLDKFTIMNLVAGNPDRHNGNYMYDRDSGTVKLIDHGYAYSPNWGGLIGNPDYLTAYFRMTNRNKHDTIVHPKAVKWVLGLDADKLEELLKSHWIDHPRGPARLRHIQNILRKNPNATRAEVYGRPPFEPDPYAPMSQG